MTALEALLSSMAVYLGMVWLTHESFKVTRPLPHPVLTLVVLPLGVIVVMALGLIPIGPSLVILILIAAVPVYRALRSRTALRPQKTT